MGSWTSEGAYVPSKLEVAQMQKNQWKKRAGCSENAMSRIRAILEDPDMETDEQIVDAVIETLEQWEVVMERRKVCGDLWSGVYCTLPAGHKSSHIGTDQYNKRREWSSAEPEPAVKCQQPHQEAVS